MPQGKYFFIVSRLNGLVLDIEDESTDTGAHVCTWERKSEEPDNQLWYFDLTTGTIRSKLNNLCMTGSEDGIYMEEYGEGNDEQQWCYRPDSGALKARDDRDLVFDIFDCNEDPGARVGLYEENGGDNQCWDIERVEVRYFMIRSVMDDNKVLDIEDANADEGANVVIWRESGDDNQLWYEDDENIIRSKLNGYALTADEGEEVTMQECDQGRREQQWHRWDEHIVCRRRPRLVLDIEEGESRRGTKVLAYERTGGDNQKWTYEYRV